MILLNFIYLLQVLALIPDDELKAECAKHMEKGKNGIDRWNKLRDTCVQYTREKSWKGRKTSEFIMMEIMLQFAYPRYVSGVLA